MTVEDMFRADVNFVVNVFKEANVSLFTQKIIELIKGSKINVLHVIVVYFHV